MKLYNTRVSNTIINNINTNITIEFLYNNIKNSVSIDIEFKGDLIDNSLNKVDFAKAIIKDY